MPVDVVTARDKVVATIEREPTPPRFPCPKCGKESKRRDGGGHTCVGCGHVHGWVRRGECNRCGECCATGDPFAPRQPKSARQRPCSYLAMVDGRATCAARTMANAPERVRRYLEMACYPFPQHEYQPPHYPSCGFWFERIDGD